MQPRIQIESQNGSLRVIMPYRKIWREYPTFALIVVTIFFTLFVVGTLFITAVFIPGFWSQLQSRFNGFSLVCFIWSAAFPLMLGYTVYLLLRMWRGYEIAEFNQERLTISKIEFGITRTRAYSARDITNLEMYLIRGSLWERSFEGWGFTPGALEFDYRNKHVRFGASLDDAEAEYVLTTVKAQYPHYLQRKG